MFLKLGLSGPFLVGCCLGGALLRAGAQVRCDWLVPALWARLRGGGASVVPRGAGQPGTFYLGLLPSVCTGVL